MTSSFEERWGIQINDSERAANLAFRITSYFDYAGIMQYYERHDFRRKISLMRGYHYENYDFIKSIEIGFKSDDNGFSKTSLGSELKECVSVLYIAKIVEDILNAALYIDLNRKKTEKRVFNVKFLERATQEVLTDFGFAPFSVEFIESQYITIPSLNKFHENKLYERVLPKLSLYPKSKLHLAKALKYIIEDGNIRSGLDESRFALEKPLREVLSNRKNLSNQVSDLGRFLKNRGITDMFISHYIANLQWYDKYQNENVKHNFNELKQIEAEYIIFQTLALMDMIL